LPTVTARRSSTCWHRGERSVDDLAAEIGQSVANTSQHLPVLRQAGFVQSRRAGRGVFDRPASQVVDLWMAVRGVAVEQRGQRRRAG
jgi:DNA-binding transcriptional ArsR family regulator